MEGNVRTQPCQFVIDKDKWTNQSFGNIDFDWELSFALQVNKHLQANVGTHLIYDDDIKFDEVVAEDGTITDPGEPRIQFKQALGIGLGYTF